MESVVVAHNSHFFYFSDEAVWDDAHERVPASVIYCPKEDNTFLFA
jgi:hypothetical protein